MKIPESLKNVLSEADLADIKKEFDKQVQIQVESALRQYDDEAEKRILELVKQIDENHKVKLVNLLKKKDAKDKALLESIKAKYTEALRTDAEKFKASLAKNIERFIESKIGNIVDYSIIKEAALNNTARIVLEGLRTQLGVDSALMKESISGPILEAREKMTKALSYIKKLKEENQRLEESLYNSEANLLIESRTAKLPEAEASHMKRMLHGKDIKFINENFNYILDLYRQGQEKKRTVLKEEALKVRDKKKLPTEPRRTKDLMTENSSNNSGFSLIDEIAAEMGISEDKVREIIKVAQEPVSLETPIGEEEDSHLGDFIPDDDAPAPADAASHILLKEQLAEVLDTLTPREEKVLRLRFGLEDGRSRTLEEVGKEFNVTRERIRQIEAKALRKLRHPSRSKKLKDFLD